MGEINALPDELLLYIFQFTSQTDVICNIRNVCSQWEMISFSSNFWRYIETVGVETDIEKLIWSKKNIKEIKHFVRNIHIRMTAGTTIFTKLKDCKLTQVEQLTLEESSHGNTDIISILEYLAEENTHLSSLSLSFYTCDHIDDIFRVLLNLPLRKLKLIHGDSIKRWRHLFRCRGCSERKWTTCLSKLCAGRGKDLHELSLGVGKVNHVGVKHILLHCKYLESLALSVKGTSSDWFDELPQTTNLTRLGLYNVNVTDGTLIGLAKCAPFLKLFKVQGNSKMITDHGMTKLSEKCKYIEKIVFRNKYQQPPKLTDLTLFSIASNCKSLKCLRLKALKSINDAGFQTLVKHCPNLVEISILSCCNLTDLSLIALGENCRLVKKVKFSGAMTDYKHMTNKGVEHLIKKLKYLEKGKFTVFTNLRNIELSRDIDISHLNLVEGKGHARNNDAQDLVEPVSDDNHNLPHIVEINSNHSHVRHLSFARCELLDDESVLQILKFCPDLRKIDLCNCTNISEEISESVFKLCKFIPEVKINGRIFVREPK